MGNTVYTSAVVNLSTTLMFAKLDTSGTCNPIELISPARSPLQSEPIGVGYTNENHDFINIDWEDLLRHGYIGIKPSGNHRFEYDIKNPYVTIVSKTKGIVANCAKLSYEEDVYLEQLQSGAITMESIYDIINPKMMNRE